MATATMSVARPAHLLAPAAVLAVVLLMIVPLPPLLLDLLLSVDIGLAVVLLLTAIYVKQPVEFSAFPSLLLLLTLIRLALNVASTRLVLLHGADGIDAAGHVIMSFGQFVVGGSFVVGVVVFAVLVGCSRTSSESSDAGSGRATTALRVGSCDRSASAGTCSEYDGVYLGQNEVLLTSSCGKLGGTFVFAACPNTSVIGACVLSTGEMRKFYATGASAYDPQRARTECETTFRGSWKAHP